MLNRPLLKRTPLFDQHLKLGAKMVPFGGWEMPVSYKGIIEEHAAVREAVGLFDIGHMGLVKVEGEEALPFLQKVATNDASRLEINACQYSVLCNLNGGTVDDILVYRLPMHYLIVCNAANTEKDLSWFSAQAKNFHSLSVVPYENYCMLSLQGPLAAEITQKVLSLGVNALPRNHLLWWRDIIISRTGYTGSDGLEFIVAKKEAEKVWLGFLAAGALPCGLGARDTLRLEAGLPLYGHEYDEDASPLETGYGWAVKFDKGDFIGRESLLKQKELGLKKKLVGLSLSGRAIPREGCLVFSSDGTQNLGRVTSGTFSPTFKRPLALAYLVPEFTALETTVAIEIRGNKVPAKVVAKTFYKR